MAGADLVQLLLSGGIVGVLVAVINAIVNRRKLSAEATEIITKAAAGTVENVMADNARLREELVTVRSDVTALKLSLALAEERERGHQLADQRNREHLALWHRYCASHSDSIRAMGGDPGPPPPMWPEDVTPPVAGR